MTKIQMGKISLPMEARTAMTPTPQRLKVLQKLGTTEWITTVMVKVITTKIRMDKMH